MISNIWNWIKNIFKPEITIKVGETELRGIIQDEIAKNSREVNK